MVKQLQWAWKRKENKEMFSKRLEKETFKQTVKENIKTCNAESVRQGRCKDRILHVNGVPYGPRPGEQSD